MAVLEPTSRYAGLATIEVEVEGGPVRRLGVPRIVPTPPRAGTYEIRDGDRLDLLGQGAVGDSTRWWLLADANPWPDATRLERAGQIIELPHA